MILLAALLHLALLTTNKYPACYKPDDSLLIEALRDHEIEVQSVDWRSLDTDWSHFDAAPIFSTWDYCKDHAKFLKLLRQIENRGVRVYNSPAIIEWNSRKTYLHDLEKLGLKTIETAYIAHSELNDLQSILIEKGWDECIIKPQISTSGHNTYRLNLSNTKYVQDLLKTCDEDFMIQPFAEEIQSEGEWSFVFFNNEYMHCVLKKPPKGEYLVQTLNLPTFQTRIDVIRRGDEIRIMEIEMIKPNLYLKYFPGSEKKVAEELTKQLQHYTPSLR